MADLEPGCTPSRAPAHRRRVRGERGVSGVEFLVAVVAVLFLFATLVQYGVRLHAARVAEAAAREGAVAAARFDGTNSSGRAAARGYLSGPAIRGATVTVARGPTQARVRVTVHLVTLLPILPDRVTSTATAPVERYVP